jgi:hypothetical protein
MDYARREFPGTIEWVLPYLLSAAKRVFDDVYEFEYDPARGVTRWVEYERQSLPVASGGNGGQSRSNLGFDFQWFAPLIMFLLRNTGSLTTSPNGGQLAKANAIWAQLLAESTPHDKSWFPPNSLGGAPTLVSILVSPDPTAVTVGNTRQFSAIGTYSDSSTVDITESVTWASSATGVATISNTAGSRGLATAVTAGTCTITATDVATSVFDTAALAVTATTLVSIAVTPSSQTILVGQQVQYTAVGTYSDNSTLNITQAVTWSVSTDNDMPTITAGGLATRTHRFPDRGCTGTCRSHPGSNPGPSA